MQAAVCRSTLIFNRVFEVHKLCLADHILVLGLKGSILAQGQFEHVQGHILHARSQSLDAISLTGAEMRHERALDMQLHGIEVSRGVSEHNTNGGQFATFQYYFSTAPFYAWGTFYVSLMIYVFFQVFPSMF